MLREECYQELLSTLAQEDEVVKSQLLIPAAVYFLAGHGLCFEFEVEE